MYVVDGYISVFQINYLSVGVTIGFALVAFRAMVVLRYMVEGNISEWVKQKISNERRLEVLL